MVKEHNSLLKLAKEIQEHFPGFYLAGGTALMLRHKHRVSIDLDFFNHRSFSFAHLAAKTRKLFHVEAEERLMASDYDIFLNKIYVAGRRVDPKDSYDAAFLYKTYKWKPAAIKKDFEKKFQGQSYPKLPKWVKSTLLELIQ